MTAQKRVFRVALTGDFFDAGGRPLYSDIGTSVLDAAEGIEYWPLRENLRELSPEQIADAQGVVVLGPRVTTHSLSSAANLLAIGRFGVGYDSVDVEACTAADVALVTTVGAVDRPVAEATLGWMIALAQQRAAPRTAWCAKRGGANAASSWAANCASGRWA